MEKTPVPAPGPAQARDIAHGGARGDLLAWLSEPDPQRGVSFARPDGGWDRWCYPRLATLTRQVAAGMAARGLGPGTTAAIVQRSGPEFVASLFGAMLAGGAAAPIAPPMRFTHPDRYRDYLAGLLAGCRPRLIVTEPDLAGPLRDLAGPAACRVVPVADLAGPELAPAAPDGPPADQELVLMQFTSGSSGVARTVRVPATALHANVTAIRRWLRWTSADPVASWLPVHHDMGLIGCLITPVVSRSDLWLLPAEEFIRRPARYLRCFGESGARLTAMPTFGLEHITRKVQPADLAGLDFSAWRAAIIGAEHLDAAVLDRFCELLAPHGFQRLALLPAYGLAEATLAATGVPLDEQWEATTVDPAALTAGQPAELTPGDDAGVALVGCGRPLHGMTVRIVDGDGAELPDGWLGEIELCGPSVAAGYAGHPATSASQFLNGQLRTGDAGFLTGGQLVVLGRFGDSLKIRGRSVFAEDVEAAVHSAGVPGRRVAAALGVHQGRPTAVVVLEDQDQELRVRAEAAARRYTEHADLVIVPVPRGTIPRTTSGKIRRRQIWEVFAAGAIPAAAST